MKGKRVVMVNHNRISGKKGETTRIELTLMVE